MTWWQQAFVYIGAAASVVTVLGAAAWLLGRRKVLGYRRPPMERPVWSPLSSRLEVNVDGGRLTQFEFQAIRVWNAGFSTIAPQDFADPLRFVVTHGKPLLVVFVRHLKKAGSPKYQPAGDGVAFLSVDPLHLRRGEGVEVGLVTVGGNLSVDTTLHAGDLIDYDQPRLKRWRSRFGRRRRRR